MSDGSSGVAGDLRDFTPGTVQVVEAAETEARSLGHGRIGTEHLLLALLAYENGIASAVLTGAGASLGPVRRKVIEAVGAAGRAAAVQEWTPRAVRAIGRAPRFARDAGIDLVHSDHLLLAVLDVEGTAGQVLRGLGIDVDQLADNLRTARALAEEDELVAPVVAGPVAEPETTSGTATRPVHCWHCGADLRAGVLGTDVPVIARDAGALLLSCPDCNTILGISR